MKIKKEKAITSLAIIAGGFVTLAFANWTLYVGEWNSFSRVLLAFVIIGCVLYTE